MYCDGGRHVTSGQEATRPCSQALLWPGVYFCHVTTVAGSQRRGLQSTEILQMQAKQTHQECGTPRSSCTRRIQPQTQHQNCTSNAWMPHDAPLCGAKVGDFDCATRRKRLKVSTDAASSFDHDAAGAESRSPQNLRKSSFRDALKVQPLCGCRA